MIKRFLLENIWTKLAAVLLAVLVWFYISGEERITVTKDIPVTVLLPGDYVLTGNSASTVRIGLSGPREVMKDIDAQSLAAVKDLRQTSAPGSVTFPVSDKELRIPKYTSLLDVSPREVTVTLDRLIEKDMKVEAALRDRPPEGYAVEKIELNPSIVKVTGPESDLKKLASINTKRLDLTGRTNSFAQKVELEPLLDKYPCKEQVDVIVTIKEQSSQKSFDRKGVTLLAAPSQQVRVSLEPAAVELTVSGPAALVAKTEEKNLSCYVDIQNLAAGEYDLPIQTILPKDIVVSGLKPDHVKVIINEEGLRVQTHTTIEAPKKVEKEEP
ncbi:MAG TPA: CdaR family protein [bacterium]|nr:CdaR family protein [bacterium]